MEKLSLTAVAQMCRGTYSVDALAEKKIRGVSIDSRDLQPDDLFVALKGGRRDGHDFLEEAARKGAAAMVGPQETKRGTPAFPFIFVDDTLTGLQSLARNYRATLPLRTVAVAGSNGKTGTKEMVAAVLGARFSVLKNKGNLNNHIGVPISLLKLDRSHQVGVFEVGTNHPGELIPLLEMVRPWAGIITTIGEEHLEYFHDLEGVAQEEGTLAEMLPEEGLLALNSDDPWSEAIRRRCRANVATFGFARTANYRATTIGLSLSGTQFKMATPKGKLDITLNLLGRHQVANALAAAAVGEFFGLELEEIRQGLESVAPSKMRMEWSLTSEGVCIINDAYNANPSSMRAALKAVQELPVSGRRFAVLGEMRELGGISELAHREAGERAAESGVDILIAVGEAAKPILEGARNAQHPPSCIEFFPDPEGAGEFLRKYASRGDAVLIKASRGAALEKALEGWK